MTRRRGTRAAKYFLVAVKLNSFRFALSVALICGCQMKKPNVVLRVRGPTQVTKLPGYYFPQDPDNALLATLQDGKFEALRQASGSSKGGGIYYLIRLPDGREGYVQPGKSAPDMWYAKTVNGLEWRYSRVTDVEVVPKVS